MSRVRSAADAGGRVMMQRKVGKRWGAQLRDHAVGGRFRWSGSGPRLVHCSPAVGQAGGHTRPRVGLLIGARGRHVVSP